MLSRQYGDVLRGVSGVLPSAKAVLAAHPVVIAAVARSSECRFEAFWRSIIDAAWQRGQPCATCAPEGVAAVQILVISQHLSVSLLSGEPTWSHQDAFELLSILPWTAKPGLCPQEHKEEW